MVDELDEAVPPSGPRPPSPARKSAWTSRIPGVGALREARLERDKALSERNHAMRERDNLRKAIRSVRAERNSARSALQESRTELVAMSGSLVAAARERDIRIEKASEELLEIVRQTKALQEVTDRRVKDLHHELLSDMQALVQLLSRYQPQARLPIVAGWALSPGGLLALTDIIERREAVTIVECGSGTSTLWMGYALKKLGRGKVIALDHLPKFAEKTRAMVEEHGLSDFVEVRLAPLAPRQTPRGEFRWYSVETGTLPESIDVVLVDGPPQSTGRHARYPALSALQATLAPTAILIADDTDRRDEREILRMWQADEPRLQRLDSPARGVEILQIQE